MMAGFRRPGAPTLMALCGLLFASASAQDDFLIDCAMSQPDCQNIMSLSPPPLFDVQFVTTKGNFTVHVNISWAPPMARRFYILSVLSYFDGSPFYRVLNLNATERFVAQWGYRAVPSVDQAWIGHQMDNTTVAVVPPGNAAGTVAFGTSEISNNGQNPNCTSTDCSIGFSVELFVNLGNNSRLDGADFSPFGWIEDTDMQQVLLQLYAGYGECADECASEEGSTAGQALEPSRPGLQSSSSASPDPYCVPDPATGGWAGVNLTHMLSDQGGQPYLKQGFPLLDYVIQTVVLQR